MKIINGILIGTVCLTLCACGGKKSTDSESEEETVSEYMKPSTTKVSGPLGSDFKVIDRNYKVSGEFSKLITVELERTDSPLPFNTEGYEICSYGTYMSSPNIQVGFGIEFLDDEGNILSKSDASSGGYSHSEAVDLVNLTSGDTGTIRFSLYSDAQKATQFRITSAYKINEGSSSSSSTTSVDDEGSSSSYSSSMDDDDDDEEVVSKSKSSSSSKNWNALLDSYEQYVDKYISYMKKAANGDMSALSEYPALMQKAQEFSEQMENAQGDMTAAQWARYMKITQKMMNAAASM